ncbi:MAG TPA: S8 family serine peptidase [Gaiellaceae bacterium]|nr:S8 family serine peptidase [Gaiellaceae bacterium]
MDATAKTAALARAAGVSPKLEYSAALKGFAADLTAAQLAAVRADPGVAFVSPDQPVEAVGFVPLKSGETAPTGVRRIGAATTTTTHTLSKARVAVIDTGIQLGHPDLNASNGKNCISSGKAIDDNGHGTHVAGTIAAKNNGSRVVGVAPGTKLFAVKVLNSGGSGSTSQVVCGIDWVTAHGPGTRKNIRVASMSLGGGGANDNNCGHSNSDPMHVAICNSVAKGITYVVAAGNNGTNFSTFVPAAYPEVLTVTASADSDGGPGGTGGPASCPPSPGGADDTSAGFSNYASSSDAAQVAHTIAAPGTCILSDWLSSGTRTISGTSMATPHVTGTVALCLNDNGAAGPCNGKTPAQIISILRANAASHATPANGFAGDPNHPTGSRYYGFLNDASTY